MGRSLNAKTLMIWFWKSVFQGCVIMLGAIMCFKESFTNIVTITFSALIIIELLNVYSSVNTVNWKMIASSVLTFVIYVISIVCLRSYFDTSYMTWQFCIRIMMLTLASWMPLQLVQVVADRCNPSEFQKIMQEERGHKY